MARRQRKTANHRKALKRKQRIAKLTTRFSQMETLDKETDQR